MKVVFRRILEYITKKIRSVRDYVIGIYRKPSEAERAQNLLESVLHIASFNGYNGIVKFLIKEEVDIDAKDTHGLTPLHYAALNGKKNIVKLLIEKLADIDAKDTCAQTPLHYAAFNGNEEIVKSLIEGGADVNAKNTSFLSPLHYAAVNKCDGAIIEICKQYFRVPKEGVSIINRKEDLTFVSTKGAANHQWKKIERELLGARYPRIKDLRDELVCILKEASLLRQLEQQETLNSVRIEPLSNKQSREGF